MQIIKEYVAEKKATLKKLLSEAVTKPCMKIIRVGDDPASVKYTNNKLKDAEECGVDCELIRLPETISEQELLDVLGVLNNGQAVDGYLVQLPLPKHISEEKVTLAIDPTKDVDGFHPLSKTVAATPLGIYNYLKDMQYDFTGKNAVIIGRSNIVGKPLHKLLLDANMNVIMLHTRTSEADKRFYLEHADLVVVAAGRRNILDDSYNMKPDAVILDVGINFDETNKLCGDCNYESLVNKVAFISPVPSGVGLLTRVAVIENLMSLLEK